MHPLPIAFAALLLAAISSPAAASTDARSEQSTEWAAPPAPPAPPPPPAPPAPPSIPLPPAPPAPPPLPAIPAEAHAACDGKANGSKLSFTPGPGETMSGLCERVDGRMVFRLRSYHSKH